MLKISFNGKYKLFGKFEAQSSCLISTYLETLESGENLSMCSFSGILQQMLHT